MSKIKEGGKEKIDTLIVKKINDSIGNYRKTDQAEMYKHWYGKLFGMYRKFLVPMGIARFRGFGSAFTRKEDLTDKQKRFSYALQENEEGTYTTLVRYLLFSIKDGKKWINFKGNWNNLSDYEKHNIKRAVSEICMTKAILPLLSFFIGGADDEPKTELQYFALYQCRRLITELSTYRSIGEGFKTLRSPIPSSRLLETSLNAIANVFSLNAFDVYEQGAYEGENKIKVKLLKEVPIIKWQYRTFQDLYEFQNRDYGGSFSN
jgi:hypothetical protein